MTTPGCSEEGRSVTPTHALCALRYPTDKAGELGRGGSAPSPSRFLASPTEPNHSNRLTHSVRGGIFLARSWYDAPFRPDVYAMEQFILRALGRGDLAAADDDSEGSEQGEGDDDEDTQSEQSCWSCNR